MSGKKFRLQRFTYLHSKRGLIVPIDHGLTLGPIAGMESIQKISSWITHPAICGIIAHKGIAERLIEAESLDGKGLMIHLNGINGNSSTPHQKERLTSLETALRLGADAVSFQINFDGKNDAENLKLMGTIVDEAATFSLPVLAMVYDKFLPDEKKQNHFYEKEAIQRLRHFIRISIELGCDMIKIAPPASPLSLPSLLADFTSDILIFFAGGALQEESLFFSFLQTGLNAGAHGFCIGRNVFERPGCQRILSKMQKLLTEKKLESQTERVLYGAH